MWLKWVLPILTLGGWLRAALCGTFHGRGPGYGYNWMKWLITLPLPIIPKLASKFINWWWPELNQVIREKIRDIIPDTPPGYLERLQEWMINHPFLTGLSICAISVTVGLALYYLLGDRGATPPTNDVDCQANLFVPQKSEDLIKFSESSIQWGSGGRILRLPRTPDDDPTPPSIDLVETAKEYVPGDKVGPLKKLLAKSEALSPSPDNIPEFASDQLPASASRSSGGPWHGKRISKIVKDLITKNFDKDGASLD